MGQQGPMMVMGARSIVGNFLSAPGLGGHDGTAVVMVKLAEIYRPPQPRRLFSAQSLEKLKRAIEETGFQGAVLVMRLPLGAKERDEGFVYELVYGASRCRAMAELGHELIPALVRESLTEAQKHRIRLDENLMRTDLGPLEELEGLLEAMADTVGLSTLEVEQDLNAWSNGLKRKTELTVEVLRRIEEYQSLLHRYQRGKLSSFRAKLLRFRALPEEIKLALEAGKLEGSKALELSGVQDAETRRALLAQAVEGLTVQELRRLKRGQAQGQTVSGDTPRVQVERLWKQVMQSPLWSQPSEAMVQELETIRQALERIRALESTTQAQG